MLRIIPLSCVRSITPTITGSYFIGHADIDENLIEDFGCKPVAGKKDFTGNRHCDHKNYHGNLYYNDIGTKCSGGPTVALSRIYRAFGGKATLFNVTHTEGTVRNIVYLSTPRLETCYQPVHCFYQDETKYQVYSSGYSSGNEGDRRKLHYFAASHLTGIFGPYSWLNGYTIEIYYDFTTQSSKLRHTAHEIKWDISTMPQPPFGLKLFRAEGDSTTGYVRCNYRTVGVNMNDYLKENSNVVNSFAQDVFNHFLKTSEVVSWDYYRRRYYVLSNTRVERSYESMHYAIESLYRRSRPEITNEKFGLGEATQVAANRARRFTGNSLQLSRELIQIRDTLRSILDLRHGKLDPKKISNIYLSYKYGIRLTVQDASKLSKSVISSLKKEKRLYAVSRGSVMLGYTKYSCKLYYSPETRNNLAKISATLMEFDAFPTLQNVWDLIPYSFVADWFTCIDEYLNDIDTRTYLSVMNIFHTVYSIKQKWKPNSSMNMLGCFGTFEFTYYRRFSEKLPIAPVPSFSGGQPSEHIIEGAALIIQRL